MYGFGQTTFSLLPVMVVTGIPHLRTFEALRTLTLIISTFLSISVSILISAFIVYIYIYIYVCIYIYLSINPRTSKKAGLGSPQIRHSVALEVFARLNAQLNEEAPSAMPKRCLEPGPLRGHPESPGWLL